MNCGFVGIVSADLHLPTADSLKDKRKPLAGLKAALVRATGCSVSEVDFHDRTRRARVSLAVTSVSGGEADRLCDVAERVIFGGEFEVLAVWRQIVSVAELFEGLGVD